MRRRAGRERRPEAGRLGDLGMRRGLQPLADASAGRRRSTETLAGTARTAVSPAVHRVITRRCPAIREPSRPRPTRQVHPVALDIGPTCPPPATASCSPNAAVTAKGSSSATHTEYGTPIAGSSQTSFFFLFFPCNNPVMETILGVRSSTSYTTVATDRHGDGRNAWDSAGADS